MSLATQEVVAGDLESAREQATTALSLARAVGNTRIVAATQSLLGVNRVLSGRRRQRGAAPTGLSATARAAADPWPTGIALINLSNVTESTGEYDRSMGYLREALQISRETGDHLVALHGIEAVGELHLRLGAPRTAARLLAAADRYRIDYAQPLDGPERGLKDQIIEETRASGGGCPDHGPVGEDDPTARERWNPAGLPIWSPEHPNQARGPGSSGASHPDRRHLDTQGSSWPKPHPNGPSWSPSAATVTVLPCPSSTCRSPATAPTSKSSSMARGAKASSACGPSTTTALGLPRCSISRPMVTLESFGHSLPTTSARTP